MEWFVVAVVALSLALVLFRRAAVVSRNERKRLDHLRQIVEAEKLKETGREG
jgi:hypothetical protein